MIYKGVNTRATSLAEKELAAHRLLLVWAQANAMRLGQLLYVAVARLDKDLFNIEDEALLKALEGLIDVE